MLDKSKTNPTLGKEIHKFLSLNRVETPMLGIDMEKNPWEIHERIEIIEKNFRQILSVLGLDLGDDSLLESPNRIAKMYVNEIFWGLDYDNFPKITTINNKLGYDEMVIEKNINVQSNCEHHFVPIEGRAHVAYIPAQKVIGLSKINRVVEFFSKRPQIQERLTEQIYYALVKILETPDIAVMIDANHFCVKSRGIEDTGSSTVTSKLGGCFKQDPAVRMEFMNIVNNSNR
jgi:GTP cyclohydrolase IA